MLPTGIKTIDDLLQGGIPAGAISEILGESGSGKSTLALRLIASAQRLSKQCVLIDANCSYDSRWALQQGVQLDSLIVARPSSAEETEEIILSVLFSEACDLLVVDATDSLLVSNMYSFLDRMVNANAASGATIVFLTNYTENPGGCYSVHNTLMSHYASLRALLVCDDMAETIPTYRFMLKRLAGELACGDVNFTL